MCLFVASEHLSYLLYPKYHDRNIYTCSYQTLGDKQQLTEPRAPYPTLQRNSDSSFLQGLAVNSLLALNSRKDAHLDTDYGLWCRNWQTDDVLYQGSQTLKRREDQPIGPLRCLDEQGGQWSMMSSGPAGPLNNLPGTICPLTDIGKDIPSHGATVLPHHLTVFSLSFY